MSAVTKLRLVQPTKYLIEKGVHLPPRRTSYPFWDMVKGDSFLVECDPARAKQTLKNLQNAYGRFGRKNNCGFTSRKVEGGVRCWRTA